MRLAIAIVLMLAAFGPPAARAVEVDVGAETQVVYDTNVFRTSENKKDDFSFRFGPSIEIGEKTDRLDASLRYQPMYEVFTRYSDANELSHDVRNSLSYRVSDRTYAEMNNHFQVLYLLNFDDPDFVDEGAPVAPDNDVSRDEMFLFDSRLKLTHALSPRWQSGTDITFNMFDPRERKQSIGSKSIAAFQNFTYAHDRSNIFGVGAGGIVQMFDEIAAVPASNTYIFRIFGSYTRHFGESTTVTFRGGPAYIMTRQDDADDETSSTFPFKPIDSDTTVGELSDEGNLNILDRFGTPTLGDNTNVPAGSVLVSNPATCIDPFVGSPPDFSLPVVFIGNRCSDKVILLRNDPNFPLEEAGADIVRSDMSDLTIFGSDSGSSDGSISFFGDISVTQRWTPQLFTTVSYNRSESTASGQGASTIADTASFITVWRPDVRWDLSMRATYVKRESPNELSRTFGLARRDGDSTSAMFGLVRLTGTSIVAETSNSVNTQRYDVVMRIARRVTRHITMSLRASYSRQESNNAVRNPNDFGDFTTILGFQYDFDPFRF